MSVNLTFISSVLITVQRLLHRATINEIPASIAVFQDYPYYLQKYSLLYKLECFLEISTNEENRITTREKLLQFFACLRSPISC